MDTPERELSRIQKRDRLISVLMLTMLGVLGSLVVLMSFLPSDLQKPHNEHINVYVFNFLLLGFVALSLLFVGYMMLKGRAVKKCQGDLAEYKISTQVSKRRLTELQAVLELTNLVNSEMVLSTVLDAISSKALETLDGDQSSLFLYDPHINKLRCVSLRGGEDERVSMALVEVGKGVAGWVVEYGKALLLDEDLNESQFRDFIKKDKRITSSLCVPLMVRNQPRGVLNITIFDSKKKFTESDLKLVSIFAETAAISIDKAGLYEKLKKQTTTLKNVIGELKSTQDQFNEKEKLRTLGNLASGISHDFKNILVGILSKTRLLSTEVRRKAVPEDIKHTLLQCVSTIEQLARNGAETAEHIQRFAGTYQASSEKDSGELDINAVVLEAVGVTRAKWKDDVEPKGIRIEMETNLGKLSNPVGNHSEIREVLTDMIYNSIDALPQGGKIKIMTRMRDNQVEIKVIDNGMGMSEETRNRIFEPFFTTKKEKGDGIGLSLALGIVSRYKGDIKVESKPGEGTSITITLPVSVQGKTGEKREAEITCAARSVLSSESF